MNNNIQIFYTFLRAGLWEHSVELSNYELVDYNEVYRLAKEQSIVGLITAGQEVVQNEWIKVHGSPFIPEDEWRFVMHTWLIEQRNVAINGFLTKLIEKLRSAGVYGLLVKGQGIAQCYERPLWREAGDIDLLLDEENYNKAKNMLLPKAQYVEKDYDFFKHIGISLNGWMVELHGTLHGRLSCRIDKTLDLIQEQMLKNREVRIWKNGDTEVYLPKPDNDVIFVFAHFLHHFFFEGVGLRQICDWCRLLWTYRKEIDVELLEHRLRKMALITEWKAFSAYAVEWLGMPADAMPLYVENAHWSKKAERINSFVLKVGNFGHNQVRNSLCSRFWLMRKLESLWIRLGLLVLHFRIFPKDSILFFIHVLISAFKAAYERNSKNKRQ